MHKNFDKAANDIVEEEIGVFHQVREAVRLQAIARQTQQDTSRATDMLKKIQEEAQQSSERDLASLYEAFHRQQSLLTTQQSQRSLPDLRSPYFAHLCYEVNGNQRHILLGHSAFDCAPAALVIVDWRSAPMAKVYFNFQEGEHFEIEVDRQILKGTVLKRRVVFIERGVMVRIKTPQYDITLANNQIFHLQSNSAGHQLAGGQGSATRVLVPVAKTSKAQAIITGLLDETQYRILQKDPDQPLLILGSAGSGKTTVTLHRLSYLNHIDPVRFNQAKLLVVVPEPGIKRLSMRLLSGLGLDRIRVETFDDWVAATVRHILPGVSRRICEATPAKISAFKRHPKMLEVIQHLCQSKKERLVKDIERSFQNIFENAADIFNNATGIYLLQKFEVFQRQLINSLATRGGIQERVRDQLLRLRQSIFDVDFERKRFLRDREALQKAVELIGADTPLVDEILRHSARQFGDGGTETNVDLGKNYGLTTDETVAMFGHEDDYEDPWRDTIDQEDFAFMLALLFKTTGQLNGLVHGAHKFTHIALDEAQEFSRLELFVLSLIREAEGSVTVAGDAMQKTDSSKEFKGWADVMEALQLKRIDTETLETSYRCSAAIMKLAKKILNLSHANSHIGERQGPPVRIDTVGSFDLLIASIAEELNILFREEPLASVAILCRDYEGAKMVYDALHEHLPEVRFVEEGSFSFEPGVDICEVSESKGLEFDYCIIPDASKQKYPPNDLSRRTLHLALTRAIHQVWLLAHDHLCEIIAETQDSEASF